MVQRRPPADHHRSLKRQTTDSGPTLPGRLKKEIPGLNTDQKRQRGSFIKVSQRKADRKKARRTKSRPQPRSHQQDQGPIARRAAPKRVSWRGLVLPGPVTPSPRPYGSAMWQDLQPQPHLELSGNKRQKPSSLDLASSRPKAATGAPLTGFDKLLQAEGYQVTFTASCFLSHSVCWTCLQAWANTANAPAGCQHWRCGV